MMKKVTMVASVLLGGLVFFGPQPAPVAAAPFGPAMSSTITQPDGLVEQVQHSNRNRHNNSYNNRHHNNRYSNHYDRNRHGQRYRNRHGNYRHYHNGYYYSSPWWLGPAAVAGAVGVAGAIANSTAQAAQGSSHVNWCLNRYRTYKPATDTFTGNDGRQHRCVSPY